MKALGTFRLAFFSLMGLRRLVTQHRAACLWIDSIRGRISRVTVQLSKQISTLTHVFRALSRSRSCSDPP
jgi:hypothetical protein